MKPGVDFRNGYRRRVVDDELDELLAQLPAILLDGLKGVGKTATAQRRCVTQRHLDDEATSTVVAADPRVILADEAPVLLDEWHRVRSVWDVVRRAVDTSPRAGRFLLTGSLPDASSHSGAGRITSVRMRPLTLEERGCATPTVSLRALMAGEATVAGRSDIDLAGYVAEIILGGLPGLRHLSGRAHTVALDGYLNQIAEHDLPTAGFAVRHPTTVLAWLRAYAAATGTTASWEKIRGAATASTDAIPARTTTQPYIELLTALRILDPVPAWTPSTNRFAGLVAAPKHHLADPALAGRLLKTSVDQLLSGAAPEPVVGRQGGLLGGLFESLVALTLRVAAQHGGAEVFHLRTQGGRHEVDFIIEGPSGVVGIEAKLSGSVHDHDVRHLLWLRDRLGDRCADTVVVHTGPEAYRRPDGVAVIPLALVGP